MKKEFEAKTNELAPLSMVMPVENFGLIAFAIMQPV
jgi:hypothetical protein